MVKFMLCTRGVNSYGNRCRRGIKSCCRYHVCRLPNGGIVEREVPILSKEVTTSYLTFEKEIFQRLT